MGKFTRNTAALKSSTKVEAKAETPSTKDKTVDPEIAALAGHTCEFTKGRKFKVGSTVDVINVKMNKYGKPYGETLIKGAVVFIDVSNVKPVKEIPAAKLALISAELEASQSERFLIPAAIQKESEAALCLQYYGDGDDIEGWHRPIWFAKRMVERLCDLDEGDAIYSVPAWKITSKKDGRPDSVAGIRELQDALQSIVDENSKPKHTLIKTAKKGK